MRDCGRLMERACSVFARFDDSVPVPPNPDGRRNSREKNSPRYQRNDAALIIEP